jgi:hypothetical protein
MLQERAKAARRPKLCVGLRRGAGIPGEARTRDMAMLEVLHVRRAAEYEESATRPRASRDRIGDIRLGVALALAVWGVIAALLWWTIV